MAHPQTIIGVDIGGTKIAAALMRGGLPASDRPGRADVETPGLVRRFTVPTDTSSQEACVAGIVACIEELAAGEAVDAVGVGVASMVDFAGGRIVDSVNLPLADLPLRDLLADRTGIPVAIDNDANVAAIGEHLFGAGVGTRDMLMLTLGTGVGGGIILDGRPYRGCSGAAAELGHIVIDLNGPECPAACPNHGCLEVYASGTGMGAAALAEARAKPASALGRALAAGETVDSRLLTTLAQQGDSDALAVLERIGEYLGVGLVTLVNIFNPELIAIGGGAAAAGELLLASARRVLAERGLSPGRDQVRVVPAELGPDAGLIGAVALALMELSAGDAIV
jgi:glucokinase